jgi:2-polyprenyl-3-methyl-5-hydroxy-6-metoxy-1,4-benzoquinol methylase
MFLRQRATQAEYCDRPDLPLEMVTSNYRQLARFNRTMWVSDAFQRVLTCWLGRQRVASLSILDIGAGDGWIGRTISGWAGRRGWKWQVTNLDVNPHALGLRPDRLNVLASACSLPFQNNSFDVVMASQMAHHLTDAEVIAHFREAWRVTRDGLFLSDAHRNGGALLVLWMVLKLIRTTPEFRADGLQSVRRGWRVGEWQRMAADAGIPQAQVWLSYGSRVMLQARKGPGIQRLRTED